MQTAILIVLILIFLGLIRVVQYLRIIAVNQNVQMDQQYHINCGRNPIPTRK